jgi:uncharacterized protein GlcG (DUF336 family)
LRSSIRRLRPRCNALEAVEPQAYIASIRSEDWVPIYERQDNCQFVSISISQHKARSAARYRRLTLAVERWLGKGDFYAYLPTLDDVIASRGGNPLVVGGKVIGAIGVSGTLIPMPSAQVAPELTRTIPTPSHLPFSRPQ